jgi:16S rRNA (adenine1518-N6/adenine1519-N6)-dimethyltransferase
MPDWPNMTSPREVMSQLERYGLKPQQSRGQNFLIDGNVVQKIVAALDVARGEAVVEVGPGVGALTQALAGREARIVALELDRGLVRLIQDLMQPFAAVKILQGDALQADWRSLCLHYFGAGVVAKLVSNLPYNISSPFMYTLLKQNFPFSRAVLMFQKEVAERIVAPPGDSNYGALSVLSQYYTAGEFLFKVSPNVFWPRPGVESGVLLFTPREKVLDEGQEAFFWKTVQGSFQQRRKTLLNSLSRVFSIPKEKAAGLLEEALIKPSARPETLSVSQFAKLSRIIYNYYNNTD